MINTADKVTRALYLARSDNRETMLTGLIENVLYQWNEPLSVKDIIQLIKDEFKFTPIGYEIQSCVNLLIRTGDVYAVEDRYHLSEESKYRVHETIVINRDKDITRKNHFTQICKDISEENISNTSSES